MNRSELSPHPSCLLPLTRLHPRQLPSRMCSQSASCTRTSAKESNSSQSTPILIQLCLHPNERDAYAIMRRLFSSSSAARYSPNVTDEFRCNVLMYSLRYQRYRLFNFLLSETSSDLDLRAQDRQGNTILHYAIIYSGDQIQLVERLIDKYEKFSLDVDVRNALGLTPLLLGQMKNAAPRRSKETRFSLRSCVRQTIRSRLATSEEHRCVAIRSRFHSIKKHHRLSSRRSERSASDPSDTKQVRSRDRDDEEKRCSRMLCDTAWMGEYSMCI